MSQIKNAALTTFAKIKVVGIGGAGGNILARMNRSQIRGVDFLVINTDTQDLHQTGIRDKIHVGKDRSKGLGTGMDPSIGQKAAEEARAQIEESLKGADMVFLTAGLGGGTGSGALPVVAEIARDMGILTVAVVTKPFLFEGSRRAQIADEALSKIQERVDAYIVVPNDRIFNVIDKDTPLEDAFKAIDEILAQAVKGLAELINMSGMINTDFSDIKAVLKDAGMALIGIGKASGEGRAIEAVKGAINSPLFEISPSGAKGVLFSVFGNDDITMVEINEAAKMVNEIVDPDAKIIFGVVKDSKIKKGEIKVLVIAAGFPGYRSPEKQQTFLGSANTTRVSIEKEEKEETEDGDNSFDIPAFLRRKK